MSEIKHSPLPWKVHKYPGHVVTEEGRVVAGCMGYQTNVVQGADETNIANAEFIVRAVNNYEALVEALEALLEAAIQNDAAFEAEYPATTAYTRKALALAKNGREG